MPQNFSKFFLTSTIYVVISHTSIGATMPSPKLTKLELHIMETLWTRGSASIREIQEDFPERDRPAYTTIYHGLPLGEQEGGSPREKGRKLSYLRGRGLAQRRPEQAH